jgi:uncharacterized membrane protein YqiK
MGVVVLLIGVVGGLFLLAAGLNKGGVWRPASAVGAALIVAIAVLLSSVVYVGSAQVGIVNKNAFGPSLKDGRIIAVSGEMGVQADVLPPGWHWGLWPLIYRVQTVPLTEIKSDEVGLIESRDGLPLDPGQLFAPEFAPAEFQSMLDARTFLTSGKGRKGAQSSVLTPGTYRINTELFKISNIKQTEVKAGEVAVLKANFGKPATLEVAGLSVSPGGPVTKSPAETAAQSAIQSGRIEDEGKLRLAREDEMGVRAAVIGPGKYPINTNAYGVVEIWTTQMIAHFTEAHASNPTSDPSGSKLQEEREITVRTNDGFTFPVDVRIEYHVKPENAPIVVAKLGDDEGDRFRNALNSAVRATFRNNAENVRALDYVQQRSMQESQSLSMLAESMAHFGVTVTAVRIGNVGDEKTLGVLLKTQTDREIAKQEQLTFQEQQKAAEQKKQLSRTTQESEEERKLATANYDVKISEQAKLKKIIEAGAEAEAIKVRAVAQAEAYKQIALQIGKSNAALIEVLKLVGERNIQITPRVMVTGQDGSGTGTALMGTMLDRMIDRSEDEPKPTPPAGK